MKIALAQISTVAGQLDVTIERMVAQSHMAADRGARLIVFPAPVLVGADVMGLGDNNEFLLDVSNAISDLADRLACAAVVPLLSQAGPIPMLEIIYIQDGKIMPLRFASVMASVQSLASNPRALESLFSADASMESPEMPLGFVLDGVNFGVAFDRESIDSFMHAPVNIDVLLYLPLACFNTDEEESALAPALSNGAFIHDASNLNAWIVAVGGVGGYDDRVFAGGSFVVAPWGELEVALPSFEEAFEVAEVNTASEGPLAHPGVFPRYDRMALLWEALVVMMRDFTAACATDLFVALKGDLRSSVVAALALDAVGPTRLHALVVDTGDPEVLKAAREQARALRADVRELTASEITRVLRDMGLEGIDFSEGAELVANLRLKAWTRMFSRDEKTCFIVGDQDKTLFALEPNASVMDADIAPLGDVYRTDVIALALHRMTISSVIPPAVVGTYEVPSLAGLDTAGITKEARLGALDAMLLLYIEQSMPLSELAEHESNTTLAEAVCSRLREMELYRRHMPLIPIVSSKTLAEAAWPITFAWRDHIRDQAEYEQAESVRERLEHAATEFVSPAQMAKEGENQVEEVMELLRDLFSQGGMTASEDKRWSTGLFSDN